MKKKLISYLALFSVSFIVVAYTYNNDSKNKILLEALSKTLANNHYLKKSIDDNLSEKVYELYLERIDYNKRYLTEGDIHQLESFEHKIDDQIREKSYSFFDLSCDIIHKRISEAHDYYEAILEKPFDFTKKEEVLFDNDTQVFAKDEEGLKEIWRKNLKYQTMVKLADFMEKKEKSDSAYIDKTFEELEQEAREKVKKNQDDLFKRLGQIEKADRRHLFLNCITNFYDPHTGYFPPKEKKDFDIRMAGQFEGIGATLQGGSDGYIKVVDIVVGSASWKQGELEVGDLILKVAQADKEPVNVVDMRLDKAVQMIRGKKGTEVRLTVKKKSGATKIIPIVRDVVVLEETFAKSLVLKDEKEKHPVGYIYLPKFYVDFNNPHGRNCSEDILKEINKLKDEKVEGIVLDLRNNGGGSLQDVVKMVGYFIEKGPVVQVKSRHKYFDKLYKDTDPKIQYDGPLTVLVNSTSASASEILAAAIQDYGRGVIIGSNSTFGKGTVQRFINMDDVVKTPIEGVKPLGALKITIQKFYRVNGGSTQLRGVVPDIVLPDQYMYIDFGEREQDNAMPWDEISPAKFTPWHLRYNIDKIKKRSEQRVNKHETFAEIEEHAKWVKEQRDKKTYTLNLEEYQLNKKQQDELSKKYEKLLDENISLKLSSLQVDMVHINEDSTRITKRDKWLEDLSKDIYLEEAYFVTRELD